MSHFIVWFLALSIVGLVAYSVSSYLEASGSVAERLAAAWRGSLTIFTLVWGAIASSLVGGFDVLADVTGDPQFTTIADSIKEVIPAQYHPVLPAVVAMIGIAARARTLPPAVPTAPTVPAVTPVPPTQS